MEVFSCMQHMIEVVEAEAFADFAAKSERERQMQIDVQLTDIFADVERLKQRTEAEAKRIDESIFALDAKTSAGDAKLMQDLEAESSTRQQNIVDVHTQLNSANAKVAN